MNDAIEPLPRICPALFLNLLSPSDAPNSVMFANEEQPITWVGKVEGYMMYRVLGNNRLISCSTRLDNKISLPHVEETSHTDSSRAVIGTGLSYDLRCASLLGYTIGMLPSCVPCSVIPDKQCIMAYDIEREFESGAID